MPEARSTPAVLNGKKQDLVSGEYAYVDYLAVLRLIGRVERVGHKVFQIRFFEGFAASVMVEHVIFHCARKSELNRRGTG